MLMRCGGCLRQFSSLYGGMCPGCMTESQAIRFKQSTHEQRMAAAGINAKARENAREKEELRQANLTPEARRQERFLDLALIISASGFTITMVVGAVTCLVLLFGKVGGTILAIVVGGASLFAVRKLLQANMPPEMRGRERFREITLIVSASLSAIAAAILVVTVLVLILGKFGATILGTVLGLAIFYAIGKVLFGF